MTMGAKADASLVVPNGWIRNKRTKMPQEVPTTVELEMSGLTTVRP